MASLLTDRLDAGPVICAEGYLFELERRGYLQAGAFVPEVVLEAPEAVTRLHEDFVHAGSDVVEAFTYYPHREKLRVIGREGDLERLNRQALRIARDVVGRHPGTILAGNICNTNPWEAADAGRQAQVRAMFEEQVAWAVEEGAGMLIAEMLDWAGEAECALEVMCATGLPTGVTLSAHRGRGTFDGVDVVEACRRLAGSGADVVGLNCQRGPETMLPLVRAIRAAVACHVAALPVPYRTTEAEPTFQSLTDPGCGCLPEGRPFPVALDPFTCNRHEIGAFAEAALAAGVRYLGVCCGAGPHHVRAVSEGRRPAASRDSADMSKHAFFGSAAKIPESYKARPGCRDRALTPLDIRRARPWRRRGGRSL